MCVYVGKRHEAVSILSFFLDGHMHNGTYYKKKLSANGLLRCYQVALSRIKQYLDAEIQEFMSVTRLRALFL